MEYKRFDNRIVMRIDRGEEIVSKLTEVAVKENIRCASVSAIGATNAFTIGAYLVEKNEYLSKNYAGTYEITSLFGNITFNNGDVYLHLHMNAADDNGHVVGGHLNRAVISATCEIFIDIIDCVIGRKSDKVTMLNIFDFNY